MNEPLIPPALWLLSFGAPIALACGFARPSWREALGRLTPWAAVPALVAALWPAPSAPIEAGWVLLGARMGADAVGRTFLFFTALLWAASAWFAQGSLVSDTKRARFHFFWLLALAGDAALTLSLDYLSFYSGFALMSFASYGLVVHSGEPQAMRAGRIYLGLVVAGEMLLFAGLVGLFGAPGGVAFEGAPAPHLGPVAAVCILAGFGVKAGLVPLHVWLPLAHPEAPVPASAVLSGAMIKAGLLGWLRFLPAGAPGVVELSTPLVAAGLGTAFFGVLVGVTQSRPKVVLAYSSISQMGLMSVGVGASLLGVAAAPGAAGAVALYALHHGLAKGALFLAVGLSHEVGEGAGRRWLRAGMLLPALSLAGAPWTSGALAKVALKEGVSGLPGGWPGALSWILPAASVGTTLLMVRFLWLVWQAEEEHSPSPRRGTMWAAWAALLGPVALAAWLWPGSEGAARKALALPAVWPSAWPVLVGAALGWLSWRRGRAWPAIPAGDLIVVAERVAAAAKRLRWWDGAAGRAAEGAREAGARWASRAWAEAGRRSEAAEARLRVFRVAGLVLILLVLAVLASLAGLPRPPAPPT